MAKELPDISPAAIERIIERLEARTRRKIKNPAFRVRLKQIAGWYLDDKVCEDKAPTPREFRIEYERLNRCFDAFRAQFIRLHDPPNFAMPFYYTGRTPDEIADKDCGVSPVIERIDNDIDQIGLLVHSAFEWACEYADQYRKGGNLPGRRWAFKATLFNLGRLYERAIDLRPGTSVETEDGGPFVAFVRDFLEVVEPGRPKNSGLAKTIKTALRELRAAAAEPDEPAELSRTCGKGSVSFLGKTWHYEITDFDALDLERLREHLPLEALEEAVRSFVRAGGRERELNGFLEGKTTSPPSP